MVDITHKNSTLRIATAQATVKLSSQATVDSINNNEVPKGNIFEMSKAAGLLAVKKTPELLPDCHPMPIESTAISYEIKDLEIIISITVKTIYKTGVEVEAMHGASVIALNMYDMLKPLDKGISIEKIQLVSKTGGKSSYQNSFTDLKSTVVVCSDTISKGIKLDKAGKAIQERLEQLNLTDINYLVIPDEKLDIENVVSTEKKKGTQLLIFTGGTGLSVRDVTPDTILPLLDREIPGIAEAARNYGQQRMPYAFLSRSVAGTIGGMLVLTLPGSTKGATETMDALFPHVLHAFKVLRGERHD
ncbi:MAG: cyclic pyranopterin phosphate synthase [Flavobacteriales bacterium]|jgi:cyclic pyranopterin phosphate synthase